MLNQQIKTPNGELATVPTEELRKLKRGLEGELLLPEDPGYDEARRVWNGLIDRRPAMIVRCASQDDVARGVKFIRQHGLSFTVRGGGHNVAGSAVADQAVTIDLSRMRDVVVDPERRQVRVAAGATLGDLDTGAQAHGLAVPTGLVSATGVAGLTLHGGLGWLTRRYGMTADNLESVDVVSADGRQIRASASVNTDLLWALRGGGGNFGIVTSFGFRAYPVGPQVWFALPLYPLERGSEVLGFFREYMSSAPDELSAIAVCWSAPDIEQVPVQHRGQPVVILAACYTGPFEKGEAAIEPLRRLGGSVADLSAPMSFLDVQHSFDEDYPDGGLYYWKSVYLEGLDAGAIEALSAHAASRPSHRSSLDIWALGGALARAGNNELSPLVCRESPFLVGIEGNWRERSENDANFRWTREVHRDLQRFAGGATYLNFAGFGEEGEQMLRRAYGDNYRRMIDVKTKYDPDNLFRDQLQIAPHGLRAPHAPIASDAPNAP